MIIAIDGPAGAGKSTIAKLIAKKINCTYINTGAMYRAVAYFLLKEEKSIESLKDSELQTLLAGIDIQFKNERTLLNGEDITEKIRTEEIAKLASTVAKNPLVRERLTHLQRQIAKKEECVVMEGRDIGTVVFPNADVKIFLTASPEERARRRYEELVAKGQNVSYEEILQQIKKRDKQDTEREIAPLKPTEDYIIIDTTNKTIEEIADNIIMIVRSKVR